MGEMISKSAPGMFTRGTYSFPGSAWEHLWICKNTDICIPRRSLGTSD